MENLIIDDIHTVRLLKQSGCKQKKKLSLITQLYF